MAKTRAATEELRKFDRYGFKCVSMEFGETNARFHPTAVKLMATDAAVQAKYPVESRKAPPKTAGVSPLPRSMPQK